MVTEFGRVLEGLGSFAMVESFSVEGILVLHVFPWASRRKKSDRAGVGFMQAGGVL